MKCDEGNIPLFNVLGRSRVIVKLFEVEADWYGVSLSSPSDLLGDTRGLLASQGASVWELFQEAEKMHR